jgi:hypothetical protein
MLDWRRRPVGRLFYWTLALISAAGFRLPERLCRLKVALLRLPSLILCT